MADLNKKKQSAGWFATIILMILADFALLISNLLHGKNVALFNPKGLIAHDQHGLLLFTLTVLLAIAIPTLFILFFIAWKYRESSPKAIHAPAYRNSKSLVAGFWLLPTAIMLLLTSVMVPATHRLVPQKLIASDVKPLTIQVISLRWKWLFIYPEQNITTINFVQLPVHTPVTFELTADDAPMSSFWIPNLGSQLYSMTSHVNRLNLLAETPGDYPGSSAEINGSGFAGMKFTARASSEYDFDNWVHSVQQSSAVLDAVMYQKILAPSVNNPTTFYVSSNPDLFASVISKYEGPGGHTH